MATGNGGQIAFAKIGSLYSAVNTVNIWGHFASETLEHKLAELAETNINGRRDAPNSYKGVDDVAGDIVCEANPNFLAHLLNANLGSFTSSLVTNAGSTGANSVFGGLAQQFHRFQPDQASYEARCYQDPYNIMMYRDVGSAWLYQGCILPSIAFDIKAGALVKVTATVMGRTAGLMQRTAAIQSLVSSGGRPWIWDQASIELSTDTTTANLAAKTNFEELNIKFDLPTAGVSLLDGNKTYGEFVPTDFRKTTIDGTMSFRDQTDYITFKNYEAVRMRATILNVNSNLALGNIASLDQTAFLGYFGIRFHLPQMKFTSWSAPISGPNRITAKFTAKAEYSESEGFSVLVDMNNIVTSTQLSQTY